MDSRCVQVVAINLLRNANYNYWPGPLTSVCYVYRIKYSKSGTINRNTCPFMSIVTHFGESRGVNSQNWSQLNFDSIITRAPLAKPFHLFCNFNVHRPQLQPHSFFPLSFVGFWSLAEEPSSPFIAPSLYSLVFAMLFRTVLLVASSYLLCSLVGSVQAYIPASPTNSSADFAVGKLNVTDTSILRLDWFYAG